MTHQADDNLKKTLASFYYDLNYGHVKIHFGFTRLGSFFPLPSLTFLLLLRSHCRFEGGMHFILSGRGMHGGEHTRFDVVWPALLSVCPSLFSCRFAASLAFSVGVRILFFALSSSRTNILVL